MSEPATDHPGTDLLADLAAEVLPREQALAVEQHVLGCARCTGLLGDAEGIRRVLRDDPVGPMPADVAARLDAALQRESRWAPESVTQAPAAQPEPAESAESAPRSRRDRRDRSREDDALTSTGTLPKESFFDEPYPTAAIPAGSIPVSSSPAAATTSRLRRADRSGIQRTRRQVRSEERTRPVLALLTTRPALGIAAGLVAVAVVGAAVHQFTGGSAAKTAASGTAAGGAADSAAAPAAAAVPVLETGTDYTSAKLVSQAKALVGKAGTFQAAQRSAESLAGAASSAPQPPAASPGATTRQAAGSAADANQLLRDPAALAACLSAIDSAGVRPVAVDLATYQGREAAILVLPAAAGGYEVWAVSRTCKPGADGTLIFKPVK
jgi:negative regulator of sigma E activity